MKRILTLLLAVLMMVAMMACAQPSQPESTQPNTSASQETDIANGEEHPTSGENTSSEETTTPEETTTSQDTTATEETLAPSVSQADFAFSFAGVELVPGAAFDPAALPEAASLYQVPSCAIEGMDNVYSYDTIEVTTFDDGTGEVIYSVFILDPNTPTAEGLYIGDTMDHVVAAYGEDYLAENGQVTYQRGDTLLVIVMDGEYVASIDFRWAVS